MSASSRSLLSPPRGAAGGAIRIGTLVAALGLVLAPAAHPSTSVGGDILIDTAWDVGGSPYIAVDTVFVRLGATLTIMPGVEVRLDPGVSILAEDSAIIADGNPDSTILFTRNNASGYWGVLAGFGSNSSLTFRDCVIEWAYWNRTYTPVDLEGMVSHVFGTTIVEDCTFRHGGRDATEFQGGSVIFRRNLIENVIRQGFNSFDQAVVLIEDTRVEHVFGDAYDITEMNGEEVTFRNNIAIDVGDDALDIDHAGYATFRDFEAYDVYDKGVSVSLNSASVVAENMIIVDARGGIEAGSGAYVVTNNSGLSVFNCVAYGCKNGFSAYKKSPNFNGGQMVVASSIAWNSVNAAVFVDSFSTIDVIYSITDTAAPYPGIGNLNLDPKFLDPQMNNPQMDDFRLAYDSPAIDAGWSDAMPATDIRGNPRIDHPGVPNTGSPPPYRYYDIGAHEFDPAATTGADGVPPLGRFGLAAFPNPAAGEVGIAFALPERREVEVGIYDAAGRLTARLFRGALAAGPHTLSWGGSGAGRTKGIYFIRLRAGDELAVEKVARVR